MKSGWLSGLILLGGMVCAEEQKALPGVDFTARFNAARTDKSIKQVVVADDFEVGLVQYVTRDPIGEETGIQFDAPAPRLRAILACVDPLGKAGLTISEAQAASGSKSVRLQDSSSVKLSFTPALSWRLYGTDLPRSGHLVMDFDVFIPEHDGCAFELMVRDYTESRREKRHHFQSHLELRCANGQLVLNGASLPVKKGAWTHVHITLPLGEADGIIKLTVTDSLSGEQTIELPLGQAVDTVSFIGLFLPDNTDGHVELDNMVISVTS